MAGRSTPGSPDEHARPVRRDDATGRAAAGGGHGGDRRGREAGSTQDEREPLPERLPRFAGATRAFHWLHAVPFLFLLATGLLILLFPSVKAAHVGGYRLVPLLHVLAGIGLIASIPLVFLLARGRSRRALVEDIRLALTPERGDAAWGRYAVLALLGAKLPAPPSGKYNLGQKLSTAFWVACTAGLIATGAVLAVNYFTKRVFGAALVERAFTWHDVLMMVSLPVLAGHLYLSLLHPGTRPSLRGILTGRVDAAWARRHHARWAAESAGPAEGRPPPTEKVSE